MHYGVLLPLLVLGIACQETANALEPLISTKGELLFEDSFTEPEPRPEWRALHGTRWEIVDGVFLGLPSTKQFQASRDNHTGATPSMLLQVPSRDSILEMSVRISGRLDSAHIGFNEGPTQSTSGHIFRLILDVNKGVYLQKDRHSQIAGDKNEILDASDWRPTRNSWITVLIETQGEEVAAQIAGGPTLRMRAARLNVSKDSGNLKARGKKGSIEYDNVRIWKALPPQ